MKMHFWRRKKRGEFTANNINASNGETGIVAVMENDQWASVSDFRGVAVAMGCNGRATARGYLGVALATRTQGEAKAVGELGLAVATGMIGEARAAADLKLIRPYEPNVVRAAWAIFGDSYRYRAQYNEYKRQRMEQERRGDLAVQVRLF